MTLSRVFFRLKKYIEYRIKARTAFALHSPFVYELYEAMKNAKLKPEDKILLQKIRRQLIKDKTKLIFNDPGAKGGQIKSTVREIFCRTSKPLKQAMVLSAAASQIKAKEILEMGTAFGSTTLCLHASNPTAHITTMEGVSKIAAYAQKNIAHVHESKIDLEIGLFANLLPKYLNKNPKIDFIFLDGHHQGDATAKYLDMLYLHLSDIAIIAIDDIYYSSDMSRFWKKMQKDIRFQLKLDFFHYGLLVKNANLQSMNFRLKPAEKYVKN